MPIKNRFRVAASLIAAAFLVSPVSAQKKTAPKKPVAPGTIGTKQMEGTDGAIGTTYSLKEKDGEFTPRFNITITGVSYTLGGVNLPDSRCFLTPEQKILAVRYIVQNPNKTDVTIASYNMARALFQAVGDDNKTYEAEDYLHTTFLDSAKPAPGKGLKLADLSLKPGQKSETIVAFLTVPPDVTVPKLVVKRGRVGTKEEVMRFDLRGKIKSDFGAFADAASPAIPKIEAAATPGTAYVLGNLEVTISDIKRESASIGEIAPLEDGKEFVTGTIAIKNVSPVPRSVWADCKPVLTILLDDGEKMPIDNKFLKPSRTEEVNYTTADPLESRKGIFYIAIPKGAKIAGLTVVEANFPNFVTRRLLYPVP